MYQVVKFDAFGDVEVSMHFEYFFDAEKAYIELLKEEAGLYDRDSVSEFNFVTNEQMTVFDDGTIVKLVMLDKIS